MRFSKPLKGSPHCVPSPDGKLIASLLPASIAICSVDSLDVIHAVPLPSEVAGPVWAFLWAPSSRKILVAVADQIHVFSALDSSFHAVIRNPAATTARPAYAQFGPTDVELCVWSAFGLKFAVFDLSTSKAVEISSPKFHQAATAPRGCSFRPGTSHMALLTRVAGRDVVSIHHPATREVQRSFQPDTVDAQGLTWTSGGRWLLVWESAAQGHKVLFYTPDGHLFRSWIGRRGSTTDDAETELGAGVKLCQLSADANQAAVCDHSRCICILDMTAATELARLRHPLTVAPRDTLQIWQEQISASVAGTPVHSFVKASQTVYPPSRPANSAAASDAKSGCLSASFDNSSSLLAVRLEDALSTVWIWDVPAAELRAVLIFHGNVVALGWHQSIRELLMVSCDGDDYSGALFVWDPLSNGPRCLDFGHLLPGRKVIGRSEASWLATEGDSATVFFHDSKHYLLASLAESDQSPPPWLRAPGKEWTTGAFSGPPADVGEQEDLSLLPADEDLSEMDDTFSFKKT